MAVLQNDNTIRIIQVDATELAKDLDFWKRVVGAQVNEPLAIEHSGRPPPPPVSPG